MKKLSWWMILTVPTLVLSACIAEPDDEPSEETGDVAQEQRNGGPGTPSCTVVQCDGLMNPFGQCVESHNGQCVRCRAGGRTVDCSNGECVERNCRPWQPAPN
jgi:hypothetical protein